MAPFLHGFLLLAEALDSTPALTTLYSCALFQWEALFIPLYIIFFKLAFPCFPLSLSSLISPTSPPYLTSITNGNFVCFHTACFMDFVLLSPFRLTGLFFLLPSFSFYFFSFCPVNHSCLTWTQRLPLPPCSTFLYLPRDSCSFLFQLRHSFPCLLLHHNDTSALSHTSFPFLRYRLA